MAPTQPLTPEQRGWLRVHTILPIAFALPLVVTMGWVLSFVNRHLGEDGPAKFITGGGAVMLLLLLIAVAQSTRNSALDARDGVARVVDARLLSTSSKKQSPYSFYAEFESIGKLNVPGEIYRQLQEDRTYRVVYSPRVKRCWDAT